MAVKEKEEAGDPRDSESHPKRRGELVGHADAELRLLQSYASGKLHHGWLITGAKGIGKATLAYRFARYILAHPDPRDAIGRSSLHVPMEAPVARRIISGGHSDLLVLQRAWDAKNKRVKGEISADDSREVTEFFQRTAGEGGWRVCIIDAADDLAKESANAILKTLEEPPARALFLLVSHSPGSLLPTIRSRCTRLALNPLPEADVATIAASLAPEADSAKRANAAALAGGSPGRALELINSNGAAAFRRFLDMAALARFDAPRKLQVGSVFSGRAAGDDFSIFGELLSGWIAEQARAHARDARGHALASAHGEIGEAFRLAEAFNLDKRQTVLDALGRIETALAAH